MALAFARCLIRQHMAKQYLLDTSLHLSDVVQLLGYSEQCTFNRAFSRWTGFSPKSYLRQNQS
ncbi:helix-turn-helix domain-containing protein [Collimonas pratensis]|uniref:helix-turn-helix domain-containing protein n=1 Tax=Collimonas pratensis TaxID=279113 RepID=UPI003C71C7E6